MICHWHVENKMRTLLIAVLFSLSAISAPGLAWAVDEASSPKFDREKWNAYRDRSSTAKNLVESKQLIGLTEDHILKMLGAPIQATSSQKFYLLQPEGPRDVSICSSNPQADFEFHRQPRPQTLPCLQLEFANGKVHNALTTTFQFKTICLPEGAPIPDNN